MYFIKKIKEIFPIMKLFKEYLNEISGLRYIFENLNLSTIGRKFLLNQEMFSSQQQQIENNNKFIALSQTNTTFKENIIFKIQNYISKINDIHTTIINLNNGQILDDIELFEIKKFAINSQNVLKLIKNEKLSELIQINNIQEVIIILNPEDLVVDSFYIFSKYDKELTKLRNEENKYYDKDKSKALEIHQKCFEIEDKIRINICKQLSQYIEKIKQNFEALQDLDVLIAKYSIINKINFSRNFVIPTISSQKITYLENFWNPFFAFLLNKDGKKYQPIDIQIDNEPILITGANMSGKTVILKTVTLLQVLYQFGFLIPATTAFFQTYDEIITIIGDKQSENSGLSSFASEMKAIDEIIKKIKSGKKIFVCIDELARTTNPNEGKAIVAALLVILKKYNVSSLITTHYDIKINNIKKLRVKGLNFNNPEKISIANLNDYMDYSLMETNNNVPNDALKIAKILNIDDDFINLIKI